MTGQSTSRQSTASHSVITAVAAREGIDPVDLHTPLYSAIDPDGLDRLVESAAGGRSELLVRFRYCGYEVTVTPSGRVTLRQ